MIQSFEVANIRCGGCANTIIKALGDAGFGEVSVDLSSEPRKVAADIADEAQLEQFKQTLRSLGYPLVGEEAGALDSAAMKMRSFVSCAIGKFSEEKEK